MQQKSPQRHLKLRNTDECTLQWFGQLSFLRTPVLCYASTTAPTTTSTNFTFAPIFGVRMCRCNDCGFVIRLFVSPLVSCLLVVGPSVYCCVHFDPLSDLSNFPCRLLISGTYRLLMLDIFNIVDLHVCRSLFKMPEWLLPRYLMFNVMFIVTT